LGGCTSAFTGMKTPPDPNEYVLIYTTYGKLAGEMIRLLLESMDIPTMLLQESAGAVYGLTVGPLGEVKILVPSAYVEEASRILNEMEAGNLEAPTDPEWIPPSQYKNNKLGPDEVIKDWRDSNFPIEGL
jgi:hypothetical protein